MFGCKHKHNCNEHCVIKLVKTVNRLLFCLHTWSKSVTNTNSLSMVPGGYYIDIDSKHFTYLTSPFYNNLNWPNNTSSTVVLFLSLILLEFVFLEVSYSDCKFCFVLFETFKACFFFLVLYAYEKCEQNNVFHLRELYDLKCFHLT